MLTRELINKPLSEYTDQEYKSAMKDMREMKECCPKKGMIIRFATKNSPGK